MLNKKMMELGKKSSVIREIFEYGNKRKAEIGEENVFDFSLGNPSIPTPKAVTDTLIGLLEEKDPILLHGYTSATGNMEVRTAIAKDIEKRFGATSNPSLIYMSCGAAASLTISLNALLNEGDEVILLAPFFPEYRVFVEKAGAEVRIVNCSENFQINLDALDKAINANTKAVIINSPNNPSGVVFDENSIVGLSKLLKQRAFEFGTDIFIIADEPYRELVYGGVTVPYIPNYYDNTIVCYSFSKSLSLPGERIGYIFVSPKVKAAADVFAAICGAGRALGYVCAPSLLQYAVKECLGQTSDISVYEENRNLLYNALSKYGYSVVRPDGAFYLFLKSPDSDATAFCERAKKYEILLVPADSFGCPGYVRISYCVKPETIKRALPAFEKLIEEYR